MMLSLTRQLVALDMLSSDLADFARGGENGAVSERYLSLLKQFHEVLAKIEQHAADYTEVGFVQAVAASGTAVQFKNKRIVTVYRRLAEFVIDFYAVTQRIHAIRDSLFDLSSEKRLELLQTRAIKAKSQFKTVVQALGKRDYQAFARHIGLTLSDWGWEVLRLENQ